MKIEIEIPQKQVVKETIDVDFPIYVHYGDTFDSGSGYDCYACIDAHLNRYEFTVDYDGKWEYEVDHIDRETLGRMVAPKRYPCSTYNYTKITAKEFADKVRELRDSLNAIVSIVRNTVGE